MNQLFARFSYQDTLVLITAFFALTISLLVSPMTYTVMVVLLGLVGFFRDYKKNLEDWVRLYVFSFFGSLLVAGSIVWILRGSEYRQKVIENILVYVIPGFLGLLMLLLAVPITVNRKIRKV